MKRMLIVFGLFTCPLIAGCGGVSEVVKVGKDTYMVSSADTTIGSGGGNLKVKLYKEAGRFCAEQKKELSPVNSSSVDWAIGRPASAELTFRCLLESDPELKRPDLKIAPNTNL
ncbi:MAG: hypothetical protein WCK54_18425 [Desulfuromonadales bacterium]